MTWHPVEHGMMPEHIPDAQILRQRRLLGDTANQPMYLPRVPLHVIAQHPHDPAGGLAESTDAIDGRRFARAIGANHPKDLPLPDGECQVMKRLLWPIGFVEMVNIDGGQPWEPGWLLLHHDRLLSRRMDDTNSTTMAQLC